MSSKKRLFRLSGLPLAALGLVAQLGATACQDEPLPPQIPPQVPPVEDMSAPTDMHQHDREDMEHIAPQPPPQPAPEPDMEEHVAPQPPQPPQPPPQPPPPQPPPQPEPEPDMREEVAPQPPPQDMD